MVKVREGGIVVYDEINRHCDARYVGPYEAAWHLLKYPIQDNSHHVELLPVHLKNRQTVYLNNYATNEQVANSLNKNTKLTAFIKYCAAHPENKFFIGIFPSLKLGMGKNGKSAKLTLMRLDVCTLCLLPMANSFT